MLKPADAATGDLLQGRYRLEQPLSQAAGMVLWRAVDTLAADLPVAIRGWWGLQDQQRIELQQRLERLQGVFHPQVPRLGALIDAPSGCWQVREWVSGRTYAELLQARRERQLVFGAGEVLLLLRQLLPALATLHGQDLIHADLTPANLVRRDSDGLPVLIDFGMSASAGGEPLTAATAGFAPPEQHLEPPAAWMDLYSLGVMAVVLLSGEEPSALMDPQTLDWRWPPGLQLDPAFKALIERLLNREPADRFSSAAAAAAELARLPMPDSTGPVSRSDRTEILVPTAPVDEPRLPQPPQTPAASDQAADPAPAPSPPLVPRRSSRDERRLAREQAAEGRFWPVVLALVLTALVGSALGWLLLGRNRQAAPEVTSLSPSLSLPPAEVDQRQQLLNRLKALQVDQDWFLKLVDHSLAAQFPERRGRPPSDSLEDAPLRKIWNDLAQEWLVRVEQLPVPLRQRLGGYTPADWKAREGTLTKQGLSPSVLQQLVSSSAQTLLPGRNPEAMPPEPVRQIWYAAALRSLEGLKVEQITPALNMTRSLTTSVDGQGARLIAIKVPKGFKLVLGVNGTPLMQMSVFGADGKVLDPRGPLRVVTVPKISGSPVQLLIRNDGLAAGLISLSVRLDPPLPEAPKPDPVLPSPPTRQPQPQAPQRESDSDGGSVLDEIKQPTVNPFQ